MKPKKQTKVKEKVAEVTPKYDLSKLHLSELKPLTDNQGIAIDSFSKNYNLVLHGVPGSGKSFIAIALCLNEILNNKSGQQLVIVRSVVPTRDSGYLPGSLEEKEAVYLSPYIAIVNELFHDGNAWKTLVGAGVIKFISTSYIRGLTLNNSLILVDEFQNCNYHELCSVITRVGKNSKVYFTGDGDQSDFEHERDKNGIIEFIEILDTLKYFKKIEFTWADCVRSGLVRDFLMSKELIKKEKQNNKEPKKRVIHG